MRNDLTKLARTYANIIDRCYSPSNHAYADYGGRGIFMCDEWVENPGKYFEWAMAQMEDTSGYQLDRKDNSLGYSPDNCRFVTPVENMRNRRNTVMLTAWGETKSIGDWEDDPRVSDEIGYINIWNRTYRGMPAEEALTKPLRQTVATKGSDRIDQRLRVAKGSHPNDPIISAWGESKHLWEWAEDVRCKVSYKTLCDRINKLGWESEDAISKRASKNNGIRYEGKTILQWSKDPACEVGYNTLATRLKNGESVQEAMKKRSTPRGRNTKKSATIDV